MVDVGGTLADVLEQIPSRYWVALGVLLLGIVLGAIVGVINRKLLRRAGVPEAVEGTPFERTLQDFGSSTVVVLARLSTYFVWGLALIVALTLAEVAFTSQFWNGVWTFLPRVFVAVLVLIVGIIVGDKVELFVREELRGYKVPQVGMLAPLAKYSVFYVAFLVAAGQLGIAVSALLVLLLVYVFAIVFLFAVAFRDMLASGAAGTWLLLNEPYGIGDEIRVGDRKGIVQEVEVFVTTVENDEGQEFIIPNRKVFQVGVVRLRD